MRDELFLSIAELSELIRNRELSPVEVVQATLDRIDAIDGKLNSYITVIKNDAIANARKAEQEIKTKKYRGLLHGVPIAVKDNIATKSAPTTCGSKILLENRTNYDATVVARLKEAGAVIIGKLNMHELAYSSLDQQSYFGPTKNPWNNEMRPGSSSAGSAAAVAAGLCHAALGTDTGGSIRFPAALCGVVGLKPTYGRVSRFGVYPLSWTLDHVGPLTRRVADVAIVLKVISGSDTNDPTCSNEPVPHYFKALTGGIEGLRVAVPSKSYLQVIDKDVEKAFASALKVLEGLGANVGDVPFPEEESTTAIAWTIIMAEASSVLERKLVEGALEDSKTMLMAGSLITAQEYLRALRLKKAIRRESLSIFRKFDVIAIPTCPMGATRFGQNEVSVGGMAVPVTEALSRFRMLFNLTGFPAVSVPCGFDRNHIPLGIQLAARPFEESTMLKVAHAYEARTQWYKTRIQI